jgi:hypothetical protein
VLAVLGVARWPKSCFYCGDVYPSWLSLIYVGRPWSFVVPRFAWIIDLSFRRILCCFLNQGPLYLSLSCCLLIQTEVAMHWEDPTVLFAWTNLFATVHLFATGGPLLEKVWWYRRSTFIWLTMDAFQYNLGGFSKTMRLWDSWDVSQL